MKLIVKYFFIADILFLVGHLRFGYIHFPLAYVCFLQVILDLHLGNYIIFFQR